MKENYKDHIITVNKTCARTTIVGKTVYFFAGGDKDKAIEKCKEEIDYYIENGEFKP